ncbi:MAG: diacylglycerol/lipid kinase family protein [Spirochaetaceae bacterium]
MSSWEETLTGTIVDCVSRGMSLFASSQGRSAGLALALNPAAGRVATARGRRELVREMEPARNLRRRPFTLLYSRYPGHLRRSVDELCRDSWERNEPLDIASCGGDGTHAEVLESAEPWAERGLTVRVVRWPMGTGNDAADAGTVRELLHRLERREFCEGVEALVVTTRRSAVRRAYNIASIGVDAFITDLTHRLRHMVPGNIYKHVADVSVLFYEQLIGVGPMEIEFSGPSGSGTLIGRYMLLAVGAGAPRTYGNHMRVLPDERNLCAIERGHIGRKVVMKRRFYAGRHVRDPKTKMARMRSASVHYGKRVPMQLDGEAIWLAKEDFPLSLRVEAGLVRVLPR